MRKLKCFFSLAFAGAATLHGDVVISEFMAANSQTLADEDGDFSDWIEIENTGPDTVDLEGWFLTDQDDFDVADTSSVWRFPTRLLAPGEHLLVFASGKNRDPAEPGQLHTDFQIDADGEFLALVEPDGTTLASAFAPAFPKQEPDVSYGRGQTALGESKFIGEGDSVALFVPIDDSLGLSWAGGSEPFDDTAWLTRQTGIGFDRSSGSGGFVLIEDFDQLLPTALDGQNAWTASTSSIVVRNDPDDAEN